MKINHEETKDAKIFFWSFFVFRLSRLIIRGSQGESDGHPQISQSCRIGERLLSVLVFLFAGFERQASTRVCARPFTPGIRHPEAELLRLSRRGKDVWAGLRTGESVLAGGDNGKVIEPSDANASRLYQFITHQAKPTMPPGKKLPDAAIETLRRWIEAGASVRRIRQGGDGREGRDEQAKLIERPITPEERGFWAFIRRAARRPRVSHPVWGANPIDAFLLAKMKAKGLKPSPRADRRTLIRRAYLDLTGLPPNPEEVEAFVKDSSPGARERLIDRLLASPHYGERWARHWLDLVRYADSGGFEFDMDRPEAWRYRDYVVKARSTTISLTINSFVSNSRATSTRPTRRKR